MKLNKNGWGTVQMILFSCGILLALGVAVYFISMLYESFSGTIGNNQYINLEIKIEEAAREYVNENKLDISGEYKITLATLKANNYISELKDINGNNCNGYVRVTKIDDINHYNGYILCNDYQTINY